MNLKKENCQSEVARKLLGCITLKEQRTQMKDKLSLAPQRLCEIFDVCNKAGCVPSTTRKRTLMSQTHGLNLFQMLGLVFGSPIRCRGKGKTDRKACCLVLYGCSHRGLPI